MADTDGKIQLAVDLSPNEAKKSARKLGKSIQNIFNSVSGQKLDSQFQKLLSNMSKGLSKSEALQKSLDKVSKQQIPTEEYENLTSTLSNAEKELDRLTQKQQALVEKNELKSITSDYEELTEQLKAQGEYIKGLEDIYGSAYGPVIEEQAAYNEIARKVEELRPQIEAMNNAEALMTEKVEKQRDVVQSIKDEMEQLVQTGNAFKPDTAGIEQAKNALVDSNNQLRMMVEAAAEYENTQSEISQQHSQEIQAQAEEIAKLLEIKLNAGEINAEISETLNRLKEVDSELEQLRARQAELESAGVGLGYEEYDKNLAKIRELENEQARLNQEVADYRQRQEEAGQSSSVWERTGNLLKKIVTDIRHPIQRFQELKKKIEETGDAASKSHPKFQKLLSTIKSLASSAIQGCVSGLKKLGSALTSVGTSSRQSEFSMKSLFSNLLKYSLGISTLVALIQKLRGAITEGLTNLAQFNGGANSTNAALTQLTSSLSYLKNAWGAAFAPILSYVAPVLSRLISMIASAANAIAHLLAALGGKGTVTVAKYKATDFAASQSKGGGGSKGKSAQEKYEEAQAKAQEKYEKKLADTQEKNAKKVAKAEEKQAKAAEKLAKKQEEANQQLGHYDKLNVITQETQEELEDYTPELLEEPELEEVNLEDFQDALGGVGDAFADMFEEVPVELSDFMQQIKDLIEAEDWEGLGRLIASKLNDGMQIVDDWINNVFRPMGVKFASALAEFGNGLVDEFDWQLLGKTIGDGLNAIADIINTFLTKFDFRKLGRGFGTALKEAFDTIEWDLIGQTFANKWNALIEFVYGIVTTPGIWKSAGDSIATFINNWFDTIEWEVLTETLVRGINGIFFALDTAIEQIHWADMGKRISDNLHVLIQGIDWENIGKTFSDAFTGILDFLLAIDWGQLAIDLGTALADLLAGVDWAGLAIRLATLFVELIAAAIAGIFAFLGELSEQLGEFFDSLGKDGAAGFFKGLGEALKDIATWIKTNMIDPLIKAVKDLLGIHSPSTVFSDFGKNIVEGLKQGIVDTWNTLKTAISEKISDMKQQFETAWGDIKSKASTMWEEIKNTITTKLETLRSNISTKIEAVKTLFNDAKTSIETIFTNMKTSVTGIFQQMWSGIKTIINSIIGGVERMANGVISAINSMVDALNALSFEVPDWVPEIGGKTFGFDLPHVPTISIPRLAQGAVIPPNREFLAMLGDQKSGTNIEAPLDTLVEAFNQALDARGGSDHSPIVLQLDGETIAQAVWDEEEKRYKQNSNYTPLYT